MIPVDPEAAPRKSGSPHCLATHFIINKSALHLIAIQVLGVIPVDSFEAGPRKSGMMMGGPGEQCFVCVCVRARVCTRTCVC